MGQPCGGRSACVYDPQISYRYEGKFGHVTRTKIILILNFLSEMSQTIPSGRLARFGDF